MRGFLLGVVCSLLLSLCFSSSAFAEKPREIRVNQRPEGVPDDVGRWVVTRGSGKRTTDNAADLNKQVRASGTSVVYVYDPKAPSPTSSLPTRRAPETAAPSIRSR